jgi:hypothetical protein
MFEWFLSEIISHLNFVFEDLLSIGKILIVKNQPETRKIYIKYQTVII